MTMLHEFSHQLPNAGKLAQLLFYNLPPPFPLPRLDNTKRRTGPGGTIGRYQHALRRATSLDHRRQQGCPPRHPKRFARQLRRIHSDRGPGYCLARREHHRPQANGQGRVGRRVHLDQPGIIDGRPEHGDSGVVHLNPSEQYSRQSCAQRFAS